MGSYDTLLQNLPQVAKPTEAKLGLKPKLKWTLVALVAYFILKRIDLWGLGAESLSQFQQLSVILGAEFGSLVSLGIGPIVTASIVLQLLNGSGIINFDTTTSLGRSRFQGTQKILALFFIVFESIIFVMMGGLRPDPALMGTSLYLIMQWMLIFQIILGGIVILFLDDLTTKWGIGSGISLFIAAGVSESLFIQTFSFIRPDGGVPVGAIPQIIYYLGSGQLGEIWLPVALILSTLGVFAMVVYVQSMKVEIPLSFGRVRGYGIRWPLNFLYTSNIPVILISALLAQAQLLAAFFSNFADPAWVDWVSPPQRSESFFGLLTTVGITNMGSLFFMQAAVYGIVLMTGAMVFAYFWMQTAGMDAKSQAKQIMSSGLQIPGFRKDPRVIEHVLSRYIVPLTIMGGLAVGFLAATADIMGSLTSGTGLLLAVMIIYKFYQDIAKQHMQDMNPLMRKFMGGK